MAERGLIEELSRVESVVDLKDRLNEAVKLLEILRVSLFMAAEDELDPPKRFLDALGLLAWIVQDLIERSAEAFSSLRK